MRKILKAWPQKAWPQKAWSDRRTIETWSSRLTNETGTVESALTIIPLMLLFLTILQISVSVMGRTSALSGLQDEITRHSLYGSANSSNLARDSALPGSDGGTSTYSSSTTSIQSLPLTGGGALILGTRQAQIPILTPLLFGRDAFNTSALTVDENN
jgi:hypothetical protein